MFTKKKIRTSENGTKRIKSSKGPDLGLLFFTFQNFLFLITCSKVLIVYINKFINLRKLFKSANTSI